MPLSHCRVMNIVSPFVIIFLMMFGIRWWKESNLAPQWNDKRGVSSQSGDATNITHFSTTIQQLLPISHRRIHNNLHPYVIIFPMIPCRRLYKKSNIALICKEKGAVLWKPALSCRSTGKKRARRPPTLPTTIRRSEMPLSHQFVDIIFRPFGIIFSMMSCKRW